MLYHPGANVTRLYFGTDTHAQSILVGSVLACVLTLVQRHRGLIGMAPTAASRPARVGLTVLGLAGLAGTARADHLPVRHQAFLYRGGFLLSALSAAALITGAVCVAGGPIARVLSVRPMVWMGTVSYGAYLWHFPVFIELDAGRTGLTGPSLLAARVRRPPSRSPQAATTWSSDRSWRACSGGRSRRPSRPWPPWAATVSWWWPARRSRRRPRPRSSH